MAADLVLDTAIRDWVLIPLSVVMVLIGVLRYFVSKLMRSSQLPDAKIVKEGQVIIRARNLRASANFIPSKSFRARKAYFGNEENGLLFVPKGQAQNAQAQMFSDPNMAMDMMKKNLSMIIPQTLTFAWVNFFFSGFVAAKIPFPLTQRFRSMLQNGIDYSTIDVSYVSTTDDTQRMMQMSGFGFDPSKNLKGMRAASCGSREAYDACLVSDSGGAMCSTRLQYLCFHKGGYDVTVVLGTAGQSSKKNHFTISLGAEKDGLDIIQHEWALPKFEQRAEATLRKLIS
ncbi:hypothetical protein TEA_014490 [Camellia sinensis var. sinensis]|uniref:ER membrane protein complex subunit 3 n=1 Tax=Camellia sinensis var. sinensis TaxID=542762 RepID=A0A4S4DL28_CAMSN|nr:hypothetical protein TEA_014490 [Camellia sinensis var. sinensis]